MIGAVALSLVMVGNRNVLGKSQFFQQMVAKLVRVLLMRSWNATDKDALDQRPSTVSLVNGKIGKHAANAEESGSDFGRSSSSQARVAPIANLLLMRKLDGANGSATPSCTVFGPPGPLGWIAQPHAGSARGVAGVT